MVRFVKLADSPEQHEVWLGVEQVGYISLLRGMLQVRCPNRRGEEVLMVNIGHEIGEFPNQRDRQRWLGQALSRINKWVRHRGIN